MRQNFFSEQELMAMPLGKLNRLVLNDGIKDPEEEHLVNKVMNQKRGIAPIQQRVTLRKDLDITDQRQEQEWEAELARRTQAMRPAAPVEAKIQEAEAPVVQDHATQVSSQPVVAPVDVTPQDVEPIKPARKSRAPRAKKA